MATLTNRPPLVTARLKEARESRGLSQRQVADATRLSVRSIHALEEGRLHVLPPGIYRRSIIRSVAREVGLEPESLLEAFVQSYPDDLLRPEGLPAAVEPTRVRSDAWTRALAILGAIVPLVAGVAYFARTSPMPAGPTAQPTRPAPRSSDTWRPEIVPAGGFSEAPPPAARPVTMTITVSGRCDLRVTVDGGLVAARAFEGGESLRVAFSESIELSGSDAGLVQYSINGQAGRLLGAAGEPLSVLIGREDYPFFLLGR